MQRRIIAIIFISTLCFIAGMRLLASVDSIPIIKNILKRDLPPESRLRLLNKMCVLYWTSDPDSSLWYGREGLKLYNKDVSKKRIGRHDFGYGMAWENKGNVDSAFFYLNSARVRCFDARDTFYAYRSIEQIGSLYRITGRYDTAVFILTRCLEYFRSVHQDFQIMSVLFNIGSAYLESNRYSMALSYYLESASYDSLFKDPATEAMHLLGIGSVYLDLGELFALSDQKKSTNYLDLATNYFMNVMTLFGSAGITTGFCFSATNLLSAYLASGKLKQADSLLASCKECYNYPDPRIKAGFRIKKAGLLAEKKRYREAEDLLREVRFQGNEIKVLPEFQEAMLLFARLKWQRGERDSAMAIAKESIAWARRHSVFHVVLNGLNLVSDWEKSHGNFSTAVEIMELSSLYKDSLYREISQEVFDQVEISYRNKLLQATIHEISLEHEVEKSRGMIYYFTGAAVILILIIVSVVMYFRQRNAMVLKTIAEQNNLLLHEEKLIKDLEINRMSLEKQRKEDELEKVQLEMQLKEQELVFQTLQGLDLTKLTRSIRTKLEPFQIRLPKKKDQEDFARILSEIRRDSEKDPLTDFEVLFRQMHGNYYERLLRICPDLTRSELQLCALLRLNLTTKDMARIINLTVASIDVGRSKIRKKLGLDHGQSLTSFLITLR